MSLEEEFALLVEETKEKRAKPIPSIVTSSRSAKLTRTRTVYSVGEALLYKGRKSNAKLAGSTK